MCKGVVRPRLGISLFVVFLFTIAASAQEQQHVYDIPGLSFGTNKRRLDNAAKELQLDPNRVVYLFGYNKTGTKKSTVMRRLRMSKEYLVRKHRIPAKRIVTLYVGSQDPGIVMRVWVVDPKDKDFPKHF